MRSPIGRGSHEVAWLLSEERAPSPGSDSHCHASLVVNAGPHTVDGEVFEEHLSETCGAPVSVEVAEDETDLIDEMWRVVFERFDRDYDRLVAYNAESWKGGFDLPFVRTRCIRQAWSGCSPTSCSPTCGNP